MITHFTMRSYRVIRNFDLVKAFGNIERIVKPDFFLGNYLFYIILAQHVLRYYLRNMVSTVPTNQYICTTFRCGLHATC